MTWKYFYEHFYEWPQEKLEHQAKIQSAFGSPSEVAEVAYSLQGQTAYAFLIKAVEAGVVFHDEDLDDINSLTDRTTFQQIVVSMSRKGVLFSPEEIMNMEDDISEAIITILIRNSLSGGFSFSPEQIIELNSYVIEDETLMIRALRQTKATLTAEDLKKLEGSFEIETLVSIARERGLKEYYGQWEIPAIPRVPTPAYREPGFFTKVFAFLGMLSEQPQRPTRKFHVGDAVYIRYRNQSGWITDINGDLYMVRFNDGKRVDSFTEDQLEKA